MKNIFAFTFLLLMLLTPLSAQVFAIDKIHTSLQFSVERFGAVQVLGRFDEFNGSVTVNKANGQVEAADLTIDVKSIDTGYEMRDGHLTGEIWLDAGRYPEIGFQLASVKKDGDHFIATGKLTLHGVTKEVQFPFSMTGPAVDPTKSNAIGISGELVINRQDFGISFSKLMDNGQLFIGNDVAITINALAVQPK